MTTLTKIGLAIVAFAAIIAALVAGRDYRAQRQAQGRAA